MIQDQIEVESNSQTATSKEERVTTKKTKVDMEKKAELIFFPLPNIGHLASCLELAQLLINHYNHLSITILSIKLPFFPSSEPYIRSIIASQPQIKFIDLSHIEPPPPEPLKSPPEYMWTFMLSLIPHVKAILQNILSNGSNPVIGLVLDFFCVPMIDVGNELGIPSYLFMPSNVAYLNLMLSLQTLQTDYVFNDSDHLELLIPGFSNPVPSSVLPAGLLKDGRYAASYKISQRFKDTKGIIVNTFSELEKYAIDALCDGQTPPIYAVGPLINLKVQSNPNLDQTQHEKILKWLDEQAPCSVVYLCFGSKGAFDSSQTREIALGIQRSGVKFLWIMRSTPTKDNEESTLPEGFLEWMEGRGMLCGWAPQVEVLSHNAIGGFVSHCGWNSILESLWFGVPILTWPIYAEQQLNAFKMVRELGLALELRLDYKTGSDLVIAEEIEKGLKQLLDRDNLVRKKVQKMKEMARNAVLGGGSSFIAVGELIDNMIGSK